MKEIEKITFRISEKDANKINNNYLTIKDGKEGKYVKKDYYFEKIRDFIEFYIKIHNKEIFNKYIKILNKDYVEQKTITFDIKNKFEFENRLLELICKNIKCNKKELLRFIFLYEYKTLISNKENLTDSINKSEWKITVKKGR